MPPLDILADALNRCQNEDVRTPDVMAALDELAKTARVQWPFDQFRRALDYERGDARWQNANASLNAIRLNVRR